MSTVSISGRDYPVYADAAFADQYLAADAARAASWAALTEAGDKERALVSATRLLQRQAWRAGAPPPTDGAPEAVQEAASLLAADIAAKPSLGDSVATGSNVKAVGAGSARVEFFAPVAGSPLPPAALALLAGLIGAPIADAAALDAAVGGEAFGSSDFQRSRFDPDGCAWVDQVAEDPRTAWGYPG